MEGNLGSAFESLCCFLASTVLLQRGHSLPGGGESVFGPSLLSIQTGDEGPSTCLRRVYSAQVSSVVQFFEKVQRHTGSVSSQVAVGVQQLILRLLQATLKGWISTAVAELPKPSACSAESGDSEECLALLSSLSYERAFSLHPFEAFTTLSGFEENCRDCREAQEGEGQEGRESRCECMQKRQGLPSSFLVGGLALLDVCALWFASTPRLAGDFDCYSLQLVEALSPFCTAETRASDGDAAGLPPLLLPLEKALCGLTAREQLAAVLLPSGVLRLFAVCWRALPLSFAKAVTGSSNAVSNLLSGMVEVQTRLRRAAESAGSAERPLLVVHANKLSQSLTDVGCAFQGLALHKPTPVADFSSLALRSSLRFLAAAATPLATPREGAEALADAACWRWATSSLHLSALFKHFASEGRGENASAATEALVFLTLKSRASEMLCATRFQLEKLRGLLRARSENVSACGGFGLQEGLQVAFGACQWLHALVDAGVGGNSGEGVSVNEFVGASQLLLQEAEQVAALQQTQASLIAEMVMALFEAFSDRGEDGESPCRPLVAARENLLLEGLALLLSEVVHVMARTDALCAEQDVRCSMPRPSRAALEAAERGICAFAKTDVKRGECLRDGEAPAQIACLAKEVFSKALENGGCASSAKECWLACFLPLLNAASLGGSALDDEAREESLPLNLLKAILDALLSAKRSEAASQEFASLPSPLAVWTLHTATPLVSSGSAPVRLFALRVLRSLPLDCVWGVQRLKSDREGEGSSDCGDETPGEEKSAREVETETSQQGLKTAATSQFEFLEKLLALRIDLSTERQAIGLVEEVAVKTRRLQQRFESLSAEEDSTGFSCLLPPLVEISYRVLFSQLSVKLATLWPRTLEALGECFEETFRETAQTRGGEAQEEASKKRRTQQQRARAILEFGFAFLQRETHRALRDLNRERAKSAKPEAQSEKASSWSGFNNEVMESWKTRLSEERALAETDGLTRHSNLLRLAQRFCGFVGKSFTPRRANVARRAQLPEGPAVDESCLPSEGASWRRTFANQVLCFLLRYALALARQLTALTQDEEEAALAAPCVATEKGETGSSLFELGGQTAVASCLCLSSSESLVPRANDLFRAIVAFGDIDLPGSASDLLEAEVLRPEDSASIPSANEEGQGVSEEDSTRRLWKALLCRCAQELVCVRDASFQVLVLKVRPAQSCS